MSKARVTEEWFEWDEPAAIIELADGEEVLAEPGDSVLGEIDSDDDLLVWLEHIPRVLQ